MRDGTNPQKNKNELNVLKKHRVVVVFFIPNFQENYYKELDLILDKCLESIFNTINFNTTVVTLINNNSNEKVQWVIDKYIEKIDKYVLYTENKGKVYAVLNEVRAVFEQFVTVTDADILFYDGWENAVFEIYKEFPLAGSVAPIPKPYLAFFQNQSVFGFNSILGKVKYGKYVKDIDIDLYLKGTNLPNLKNRDTKFDWKEKQYVLKKKNALAVIGSYHVVSTYRTEVFRNTYTFPYKKFENSYEEIFIDYLPDELGLYKLSTLQTFAYHMGNKIDDVVVNHSNEKEIVFEDFEIINLRNVNKWIVLVNRIIGRIFIRFKWNKKLSQF